MIKSKLQFHRNTLNFFKANNLFMDRPKIMKMRKACAGFVKGAHPNMVFLQDLEDKLYTLIAK